MALPPPCQDIPWFCVWLPHPVGQVMYWLCFALYRGQSSSAAPTPTALTAFVDLKLDKSALNGSVLRPHAHIWCWCCKLLCTLEAVARAGAIHNVLNWVSCRHCMRPLPHPFHLARPPTSLLFPLPLPRTKVVVAVRAIACARVIAPIGVARLNSFSSC
jgi:hypothetical protein